MGVFDDMRGWLRGEDEATRELADRAEANSGHRTVSLDELEHGYHILEVDQASGSVVVAERDGVTKLAEPEDASGLKGGAQVSSGGATAYRRATPGDYNPELSGPSGIAKYSEMKNDSTVRSALRVVKTPILSARWFIEPASQDERDVAIANFVWDNLTQWMSISWPQFLVEALYMMDYGAYVFEKVFEFKEWAPEDVPTELHGRKVYWKKLVPIHPYEITEFEYDDEGGPATIKLSEGELDIWKALIFTYDKEAGDLWGHSILRSAYKHWFYKENLYKIDAIQKERHGIGIPVIKLPPNYGDKDKAAARVIGSNLRTNEKAYVTLPPGWEVMFLKLEGNQVDALESAEHHAVKLYENVLAQFLHATTASQAEVNEGVFMKSARFTAEIIRDVLNHYAIPQLVSWNWTEEQRSGFPVVRARRLGDEQDWRTLSFAARNLVGAGLVKPDDPLEDYFREELDWPRKDVETEREPPSRTGGTPRPPQVGSGRQSQAGDQEEAQRPPNPGRAGSDESGG